MELVYYSSPYSRSHVKSILYIYSGDKLAYVKLLILLKKKSYAVLSFISQENKTKQNKNLLFHIRKNLLKTKKKSIPSFKTQTTLSLPFYEKKFQDGKINGSRIINPILKMTLVCRGIQKYML